MDVDGVRSRATSRRSIHAMHRSLSRFAHFGIHLVLTQAVILASALPARVACMSSWNPKQGGQPRDGHPPRKLHGVKTARHALKQALGPVQVQSPPDLVLEEGLLPVGNYFFAPLTQNVLKIHGANRASTTQNTVADAGGFELATNHDDKGNAIIVDGLALVHRLACSDTATNLPHRKPEVLADDADSLGIQFFLVYEQTVCGCRCGLLDDQPIT